MVNTSTSNTDDWDHAFDGKTIDEMWSNFHTKVILICWISMYSSGSRVTPQWMNMSVLDAIKKKHKA